MERLIELLNKAGVATLESLGQSSPLGYPVVVPLAQGGSIVLDLPTPSFLATLNEDEIGVAVLDPLGYTTAVWGLARHVPHFQTGKSILDSPVAGLLEGGYQGNHGALYLDGTRYFSSAANTNGRPDIFVLVVNAQEEHGYRRQAGKNGKAAHALKRLGKTLTMNQNRQPMCVAATHEIASAAELAAVLLWVVDQDEQTLELTASVGANRQGTNALRRLSATTGSSCIAELVASNKQGFTQANVWDHVLTGDLEAKFCYLKPGGMTVLPLTIGGKLLGVLELIGRDGDATFSDSIELFQTIAEHLALAINSATMFENFERLASHDALTGLRNHRYMQDFLHQRLIEAKRADKGLSVLMVDVDHFHSFNEEEGHDAGDEVLKLIADALRSVTRPYDLAARYGGEEFVVVMPEFDAEEALRVGERIRKRVEARAYTTKSGRETHVTVSVGCASYPNSAVDSSSLLKAADLALFEAKRAGRNCVQLFTGEHLSEERPPSLDLNSLSVWMSEQEWAEAVRRLERLTEEIEEISVHLSLSQSQRVILRALVLISRRYVRAVDEYDVEVLNKMESEDAFRLLSPSLLRMNDRFDGRGQRSLGGNRIPLLARVLQVLLALDIGESVYEEDGRFDPQIVALATRMHSAA